VTKGDGVQEFSERACRQGGLGVMPATGVMMLALAYAGKLHKFGP
jgi:2,3-bisphosphoglycerate-independent phosphoglycerate mutase